MADSRHGPVPANFEESAVVVDAGL